MLIAEKLDQRWFRCRVNKRINVAADQGSTVGGGSNVILCGGGDDSRGS